MGHWPFWPRMPKIHHSLNPGFENSRHYIVVNGSFCYSQTLAIQILTANVFFLPVLISCDFTMTVTTKLNKTKLGADWKVYENVTWVILDTSPCQRSFRTIHQAALTCIREQFHSLVTRRPCNLLNCSEWNVDTKWTDIMFLDFCQ